VEVEVQDLRGVLDPAPQAGFEQSVGLRWARAAAKVAARKVILAAGHGLLEDGDAQPDGRPQHPRHDRVAGPRRATGIQPRVELTVNGRAPLVFRRLGRLAALGDLKFLLGGLTGGARKWQPDSARAHQGLPDSRIRDAATRRLLPRLTPPGRCHFAASRPPMTAHEAARGLPSKDPLIAALAMHSQGYRRRKSRRVCHAIVG
jgi:hypothetical protein